MVAKTVRVEGRVQGVGFRYSALSQAEHLGLSGWVRNEADGSVTAFVQGDPGLVEDFCRWMERGPPGARVSRCRIAPAEPDPAHQGFGIGFGGSA